MPQMQQKEKKAIRSIECTDCSRLENCDYINGMSFFERMQNVEIDCWVKKTHNNMFYSGLHKPIFLREEINTLKFVRHKWIHALNEKFDVYLEKNLRN